MEDKNEIIQFLIEHIPLRLDLRIKDLKYDTKSMYYKTYKYIKDLQEEIKELKKGSDKK